MGNVTVYPMYYLPPGAPASSVAASTGSMSGLSLRMRNGMLTYSIARSCPVEIRLCDMLGKRCLHLTGVRLPEVMLCRLTACIFRQGRISCISRLEIFRRI